MSLQDHKMQTYHNIQRKKTKFIKVLKILEYPEYRHPIIHYRPPVNGKSIQQLEVKI